MPAIWKTQQWPQYWKRSVFIPHIHIYMCCMYIHIQHWTTQAYILCVYIYNTQIWVYVYVHAYNTEQHWITTGTCIMCFYIQHTNMCICVCSVHFSHSSVSHSLWPHGLQHIRLPCPSPSPGAFSNSCASHQQCHPTITISSSVISFSSYLQSFTESGSFLMSRLFTSGGQSIGDSASASVLLMHIQDWFPLGLTGLTSLQSRDSQ